jgi:molybdopterin/thiamine biosynthesis adenylyltransferase/rhodanese-related sulfurtransferase
MNLDELKYYERQLRLQDFGHEAQARLKAARVLIIGAGGLGAPLLHYLCAAGVGTIGIMDGDSVELSNLHRQVLFTTEDIGLLKAEVAKKRLKALNPHIDIVTYPFYLTRENALEIISQYDMVADGSDNFPTRYLVNDACILCHKPLVHAAISQYEGQLTVFNYTDTHGTTSPNYRDLFPTPPAAGTVRNCEEAGVLGVLPGIIGSLQANEVIKLITGIGEVLAGKLWTMDARTLEIQTLRYMHNPSVPSVQELIDYEHFCGVRKEREDMKEISVAELKQWREQGEDIQIIDVREPYEYEQGNIGGLLIPLNTVLERANDIERNKKVVVHCKAGVRSANAIHALEQVHGFENLYNLKGGILALLEETDWVK